MTGGIHKTFPTRMKRWAQAVMQDVLALFLAGRDPRVPLPVKLLAAVIAAYALSPIDLIPDFIPIIGYLDDFILIPIAVILVVRLIPEDVMADLRAQARKKLEQPKIDNVKVIAVVIGIWGITILGIALLAIYISR